MTKNVEKVEREGDRSRHLYICVLLHRAKPLENQMNISLRNISNVPFSVFFPLALGTFQKQNAKQL